MQRRAPLLLTLVLAPLAACREGTQQSTGFVPIATSALATSGCNGADQVFGAVSEVFSDPAVIGPTSELAASGLADLVYLTGADGTVRELDFSADPLTPVASTVLATGAVDALLAGTLSSPPPAILSGIAVLDPTNLLVAEHVSNTVLIVSLVNPDPVAFWIGFPSETPSYVDNVAGAARFSFPAGTPVQLAATGDGRLFVADAGNHAVREAVLGQLITVGTAAGSGVPGSQDGSLFATGFDTPTGLAIGCDGRLLVTERGPGGNRLRLLQLGQEQFFGGREGSSDTLAGDGSDATVGGVGAAAALGAPVAPVSSADGEVYWIDASTGVLRRLDRDTGLVDCPLFSDCATAVGAGGSFSGAGHYSLVVTPSGNLYVLDGSAGKLFLVTP